MFRMIQSVALVTLCASATAMANAQELLANPGQTVALGVIGASVYYDEIGGDFRLVATIAEPLGGIAIRLVASLRPGQGISISVPAQAGKPGHRGATDPHARRPRHLLPQLSYQLKHPVESQRGGNNSDA
jgi:hypothetical protein